jgi:hypothetical protein
VHLHDKPTDKAAIKKAIEFEDYFVDEWMAKLPLNASRLKTTNILINSESQGWPL